MGPDWLHRERQDEGKGSVARNAGYGHGVGAEHGRVSTLAGPRQGKRSRGSEEGQAWGCGLLEEGWGGFARTL